MIAARASVDAAGPSCGSSAKSRASLSNVTLTSSNETAAGCRVMVAAPQRIDQAGARQFTRHRAGGAFSGARGRLFRINRGR
jgi:hypothetical protein